MTIRARLVKLPYKKYFSVIGNTAVLANSICLLTAVSLPGFF
jgi:hypothetical protein